jgi:hypothetical protein
VLHCGHFRLQLSLQRLLLRLRRRLRRLLLCLSRGLRRRRRGGGQRVQLGLLSHCQRRFCGLNGPHRRRRLRLSAPAALSLLSCLSRGFVSLDLVGDVRRLHAGWRPVGQCCRSCTLPRRRLVHRELPVCGRWWRLQQSSPGKDAGDCSSAGNLQTRRRFSASVGVSRAAARTEANSPVAVPLHRISTPQPRRRHASAGGQCAW